MKALPLKIIFLFALTYGSTSGLSVGKSVKLDIRKVASTNISAAQAENLVLDEVKPAAEFRDQPKDGEPSGEKRNLHTLDEGRGKKKKKIKGALFLMMVAMGVKCIMVLKALTVKALLASKIALVLSLLSILKKLFEKPEQKPQTNIVLKREPEHHYSRNDYINSRIDNGDIWLHDPNERLSQGHATRVRLPLAKGVFGNWRGRYYSPRGADVEDDYRLDRRYKPKIKKDRPCNRGKVYLLGSLERGRGDLDDQASEHEKKIANYELTKSRKIIPITISNNYKYTLEGNKYPYAKIIGKDQYGSTAKNGLRNWNGSDNKQKIDERHNSRETNINKGMIDHYDNEVFKGTDWENIKRPQTSATNNGFPDGRSTQVFANWDAYKKFFGNLRSADADSARPIVSSGGAIRNRHSNN